VRGLRVLKSGKPAHGALCRSSQTLLAKFLQYAFAQKIGITLTCFRTLDDPPGEDLIGAIAAIGKAHMQTISNATPMTRLVSASKL
jgi:hypothetical protein